MPPPFEHIAGMKDVLAYLDTHAKTNPQIRGQCQTSHGCDVWRVEPLLLEDLQHASDTTKQRIRALLRATSWTSHDRPDPSSLVREGKKLAIQLTPKGRELLERALDAIEHRTSGDAAESSARAIEILLLLAWKILDDERGGPLSWEQKLKPKQRFAMGLIEHMRPLRDQLYFQRLYPRWFALGSTATGSQRAE